MWVFALAFASDPAELGRRCDAGESSACGQLADTLEGSDPSSCYWIGARLTSGFGGLEKDEVRGRTFLQRACDGGYGTGCYTLAAPLLYQTPPDVAGWRKGMEKGCRGGSPDACAELKTPLSNWKELCAQGVSGACELARPKAP